LTYSEFSCSPLSCFGSEMGGRTYRHAIRAVNDIYLGTLKRCTYSALCWLLLVYIGLGVSIVLAEHCRASWCLQCERVFFLILISFISLMCYTNFPYSLDKVCQYPQRLVIWNSAGVVRVAGKRFCMGSLRLNFFVSLRKGMCSCIFLV
jgi:hypothetical protein